jgi:hypothetical protein
LVIGFIELLQLATRNEDYALTVLHVLQITVGHTMCPQYVAVFTSRRLVAASNGRRALPLGSQTMPVLNY